MYENREGKRSYCIQNHYIKEKAGSGRRKYKYAARVYIT